MKTISLIGAALICLCGLALWQCKKKPASEDPDVPTYTWKGKLYKGRGEEPSSGTFVRLESYIQPEFLVRHKREVVASGYTDQDGYFELTYKQFTTETSAVNIDGTYNNNGVGALSLIANQATIITSGPWNVDVEHDFCFVNHAILRLELSSSKAYNISDTLFISDFNPVDIVQGDIPFTKWVIQSGQIQRFMSISPVRDTIIQFKIGRGGFAGGISSTAYLNYGVGRDEIDKIISARRNDSDDSENLNRVTYSLRGWPEVDTIKIQIGN